MARRTAAGERARPRRHRRVDARGAALLFVLLAVTLTSLALLVPLRNERQAMQREREAELLFIGAQFRQALASYAAATPAGASPSPKSLDDLLQDARFPGVRRHLRRVYADPMTGRPDWVLVKEREAIVGVASRSTRAPLQRSRFDLVDRHFADATSYADWQFVHRVAAAPVAAAAVPPEPAPDTGRRAQCLASFGAALNRCGQDLTHAAACRGQARETFSACLRG